MSLAHLLSIKRDVRLGGVRLGPFQLGGHVYTIGPLSVLRLMQFSEAVNKLSAKMDADPLAMIGSGTRGVWAVLLPLFVDQPIAERDLDRATARQITAAIIAVGEANDLEYLVKQITPDEGSSESVPLEDMVCRVARYYHEPYPPALLHWPAAVFFEALDKMIAEQSGRPPGVSDVTDEERTRMLTYAHQAGLY